MGQAHRNISKGRRSNRDGSPDVRSHIVVQFRARYLQFPARKPNCAAVGRGVVRELNIAKSRGATEKQPATICRPASIADEDTASHVKVANPYRVVVSHERTVCYDRGSALINEML